MASSYFAKGLKRSALTVALGLCFAGGVHAQSTTGGIVGTAPAGSTVTITNNSGLSRTITADANGRYAAGNLPVGQYRVTAGGNARDVTVTLGSNANVSFVDDGTTTLGTVTVTAASSPKIDVRSVTTSTVLTSEELKRLPIARSAEAIALLSPGAVVGNGTFFANQIAFGGSSVAENAYYLNGYFSGNPITNVGGFTLPYGSIEQQETYTGGYGAKYGRSAGGVISQVGKSGSNEWKFGGQVVYTPESLKGERPDRSFPNLALNAPYSYSDPTLVGVDYDSGRDRKSTQTSYSGYISGPILKDRLFFFLSAEDSKSESTTPGGNPDAGFAATGTKVDAKTQKLYAKLNWNITDNHLLEYTYLAENFEQTGTQYAFDWDTYAFGAALNPTTALQDDTEFSILRYTGYLTDNLTLTVNAGHSRNKYDENPILTGNPRVTGAASQNPAINGGTPRTNTQATNQAVNNATQYTDGLRIELEYLWGDHTFNLGMDNTELKGANQGTDLVAPRWNYSKIGSDQTNISGALNVGPTGTVPGACRGAPLMDLSGGRSSNCGYVVSDVVIFNATSMSNKQKAFYLEDKWTVSDNLVLSLGVRADQFENFNNSGIRFVDSGLQWQPRLGFAWDVNGDSSFKVFGNAGRYYLNLPNAVAIRGASASTFTQQYYTYTGIDANGAPTGLTAINKAVGAGPAGPVSSNGEVGGVKDPLTYVPEDLQSQYQDEFVLGFEHALTSDWTMGAKLTSRVLQQAVDDVCDPHTLIAKAGLTEVGGYQGSFITKDSAGKFYLASYCYIFNAKGSNTYAFGEVTKDAVGPGYTVVPGSYYKAEVSTADLGFGPLKRNYTALDLFVERRWDGKWSARFDYTLSKSFGNSEGPANSDTGQGSNAHGNGVATSQNFDAAAINAFADGYLPNDRRHQFKAYGAYAITDEWLVSANVRIASGAPKSCFGYYDPDGSIDHGSDEADPIGYGSSYHTCFGESYTPGKETFGWTHRLDLGLTYSPAWLDNKLKLGVNVFNVFNQRKPTSWQSTSEDGPYSIDNEYSLPVGFTAPRSVQFTLSYDY